MRSTRIFRVIALAGGLLASCSGDIGGSGGEPETGSSGTAGPGSALGAGTGPANAGAGGDPGSDPAGAGAGDPGGTDPFVDDPPAMAGCSREERAHPGPSLALTDRQLAATVQALFPFDVQLPPLPDRRRQAHAFSTGTVSNELTLAQLTRWTEAAEDIAAQAHDNLDAMLSCSIDAEGEACVTQLVDDFGGRAFRRPVEVEERDELLTLYRSLTGDGVEPKVAASAVIAAVLQSPQFLYQLDLGAPGGTEDRFALTGHEVAAHLSYMLVNAPPDDTLKSLAESGALLEPATLREQAARLLDDPRGRTTVKRFVTEWFDVEDADYGTRVDPDLADAMVEEIDRDLDSWLFGPQATPVGGLLTSGTTSVNQPLATHYDLGSDVSTSADDWQSVDLPDHYRGGLLTKALVAARYSNLQEPSFVQRGVFVLRELMCTELGTPPPNAVDLNPELPPGALPREKSEARKAIDPCGGCHSIIDPIGLGMEELDHLGRFRTEYDTGDPVDNAGLLSALPPPEFTGTAALAQKIGSSDEFVECAALQLSEYALGEAARDNPCAARALGAAIAEGGGSVRDLILDLVTSEVFLFRTKNLDPGASP